MSSTFCIITAHENVWKEVLGMSDQVPVKYENLEQLFCQKQIKKSKGNTKPKVPSVVSIRVHEKDMIIIRIPIRVFISVWEICLIYPQYHLSGQSINEKQEILLQISFASWPIHHIKVREQCYHRSNLPASFVTSSYKRLKVRIYAHKRPIMPHYILFIIDFNFCICIVEELLIKWQVLQWGKSSSVLDTKYTTVLGILDFKFEGSSFSLGIRYVIVCILNATIVYPLWKLISVRLLLTCD